MSAFQKNVTTTHYPNSGNERTVQFTEWGFTAQALLWPALLAAALLVATVTAIGVVI